MRITTCTYAASKIYGEARALQVLSEIGFDGVDYSGFFHDATKGLWARSITEVLEHYKELKRVGNAAGIAFAQMHAPFPSYIEGSSDNPAIFSALEKSILACRALDCKYLVMHPPVLWERRYDKLTAENYALALDMYARLLPTLRETDAMIAIENMFNYDPASDRLCPTVASTAEEMCRMIDELNALAGEARFAACLDTGHAVISGDGPAAMARTLGQRLHVLHVQDNDGKNDQHDVPHTGIVDWQEFMRALSEIGYSGNFNFEADTFMAKFGPRLFTESAKMQLAIGKDLIENCYPMR